jgi:biotin carboxyl carrier protein
MRTYYVTINGKELSVRLGADGDVSLEGSRTVHEVRRLSQTEFSVIAGERQVKVIAAADGDGFDVVAGEFRGRVSVESERERLLRRYARSTAGAEAKLEVHAPMPAMVMKLRVRIGEDVQKGQPLIVLEAMKMENEILSPGAGRVKAIYAEPGKAVEKGELLLRFE